jgi:hypothetical protein
MAPSSREERQPDCGHDQNHHSNDSLNRLYPGLVESHACAPMTTAKITARSVLENMAAM